MLGKCWEVRILTFFLAFPQSPFQTNIQTALTHSSNLILVKCNEITKHAAVQNATNTKNLLYTNRSLPYNKIHAMLGLG